MSNCCSANRLGKQAHSAEGACHAPRRHREQWIAERQKLHAEEKDFTRQRDALAEKRRALPWVRVDKTYEFDSPQGRVTLADLFRGKSQLFVQHVMQGPDQPLQCVGCALGIDHLESMLPHLENHDVSCVAIARATMPELTALRERMGWRIPFYSSFGSDFNYDYGVSFKPEDMAAGRCVLQLWILRSRHRGHLRATASSIKDESGTIFHTYSNYSRGGEDFLGIYRILEVTPKGRNEHGPHFSLTDWARPHNMYGKGGEVAAQRTLHAARFLLHVSRAMEAASRREFLAAGAAVAVPCRQRAPSAGQDSVASPGIVSRQGCGDLRRRRRHRQQRVAGFRARRRAVVPGGPDAGEGPGTGRRN